MRTLYCLDREGGRVVLGQGQGRGPSALLVSRLDAEFFVVDLPPMRESLVDGALRFRLSSLYPGAPESTAIDQRRNGSRASSRLLAAMDPKSLERYRAEGLPLISPVDLARGIAGLRGGAVISWTQDWASLDRFGEDALMGSAYLRRSGQVEEDLRALLGRSADLGSVPLTVLCPAGLGREGGEVARILGELGHPVVRVVDPLDALGTLGLGRTALFPLQRRRRRVDLALGGLIVLNALLACLVLGALVDSRSRELASLKAQYAEAQQRKGESLRLQDQLGGLEARYAALLAQRRPSMYLVAADIADAVGGTARVLDLVAADGEFRLVALGPDALRTLARFEAVAGFSEVRLHESRPDGKGMERFSISGRYAHDRQ